MLNEKKTLTKTEAMQLILFSYVAMMLKNDAEVQ